MPRRCFIALTPPAASLEPLREARAAFLDAAPSWRGEKWVRLELQHVTLKFIGPVPDARIPGVVAAIERAVSGAAPIALWPDAVVAVPPSGRARMLWASMVGDVREVVELHSRVDRAVSEVLGIEVDSRSLKPHVTLARARSPRRIPPGALELAQSALQAAGGGKDAAGFPSVETVTLFASVLGPHGPSYEVIEDVALTG